MILLVNLPTSLNIGVRYMMPLFPLLALRAGGVGVVVDQTTGGGDRAAGVDRHLSAMAHPDYIAYFNELAGTHPERILVDSDLDWGQDMNRLSAEFAVAECRISAWRASTPATIPNWTYPTGTRWRPISR